MRSIDLTYNLSARDRVRIQALLDRLSLRRRGSGLHIFADPRVGLTAEIFLMFAVGSWLVRIWPNFADSDWDEILRLPNMLGYLLALGLTWRWANRIWQFLDWYRGRGKALRAGREGVNWGEHQLSVTPKALTVRLAARSAVFNWNAFSGLEKTKHMLLLMLTPRSAVAVPRRAFGSEQDELAFCDFVESRIRNCQPS